MKTLRLILADQLSENIASLRDLQSSDVVLMAEVKAEATYVKHHKKKIILLFSAMRHFAEQLRQKGIEVCYFAYDDEHAADSLFKAVQLAVQRYAVERLVVTAAGEYRLLEEMQHWHASLSLPVEILEDDRFLCSQAFFSQWAAGRKQLRMEYFYREMRKHSGYLMEDGKPVGGKWNYDSDNRKSPDSDLQPPAPQRFSIDAITAEVIELVKKHFADHFGSADDFHYAVTRAQALQVLACFIQQRLAYFGDYQDAMLQQQPWMYHSHISFYLNCGLLEPQEVIKAAENAWLQSQAPLNAVEGFIRQILGWREYVRGLYWLKMPSYKQMNYLQAKRPLPAFFWDAQTEMNCLHQCITETYENAYAHHIQRLMVLGNFMLLAGIDPDQVNEWYLLVYADAYEWVELPNVTGMILFADGGLMASKPYAASGAYIDRMSNYCKNCRYNVKLKQGKDACPFNYLYWDFLHRNRHLLGDNPRLAMPYRNLARMSDQKLQQIQSDAEKFLFKL